MALALDPRYVVELQPARRPARGPRPAGLHDSRNLPSPVRVSRTVPSTVRSGDSVVYRRRRLVAAVVFGAIALMSVLGGRAVLADPSVGSSGAIVPADQVPAQYVVQSGDTMWSIAQRFAGEVSVGAYVDALIDANGGAAILAGQPIVLP